jgi:hypothetical protein
LYTTLVFSRPEDFELIGEFIEANTGKGANALDRRPQLPAALATGRRRKCPVIVAASREFRHRSARVCRRLDRKDWPNDCRTRRKKSPPDAAYVRTPDRPFQPKILGLGRIACWITGRSAKKAIPEAAGLRDSMRRSGRRRIVDRITTLLPG